MDAEEVLVSWQRRIPDEVAAFRTFRHAQHMRLDRKCGEHSCCRHGMKHFVRRCLREAKPRRESMATFDLWLIAHTHP